MSKTDDRVSWLMPLLHYHRFRPFPESIAAAIGDVDSYVDKATNIMGEPAENLAQAFIADAARNISLDIIARNHPDNVVETMLSGIGLKTMFSEEVLYKARHESAFRGRNPDWFGICRQIASAPNLSLGESNAWHRRHHS